MATRKNESGEAAAATRSGVQSIDRAATVLRCFDGRHPELGTSEIARMTGLSTSTVHRLLTAMQHNHLVRQTADRRFGLGPMLMQLARSGALPTALRDAALPYMTELRDEVHETVGLHELLGTHQRVVVDQVESHQQLRRTYTEIGVPIELVHGAPGKAILAFLPPAAQDRCLEAPIEAVTEATITDPDALRAELAVARECGWAGSSSERTPGIRSVAAPVFDHTGSVVGSLGVSVPQVRMSDERAKELGERSRDTARLVSIALGAPTDEH
ncbi:IclR family transcriptional regulator [Solicola gregarius]|uniref:Glycerol operon regulatory protein n=1 Tax=Solicola gregarius TaxID=2908642 RepID=A0AA46TG08_9ACTN|nr:IclR family transcriptional regulator [Solicola gregarius]UYM04636.1 IclR family transcriptional regulator [Solicola gregarius]